ncbi:hypothetical protein NDU88_004050 [Pleurodeles waltl]|uniref:Uncharacterized protein n=1 Tax=Pleurodeles waltl TaxID=8319 RepID=A0AAV7V052_PLEWA|nr:hypothetical protein NDU88_004050 [Pleurodeles waltl]
MWISEGPHRGEERRHLRELCQKGTVRWLWGGQSAPGDQGEQERQPWLKREEQARKRCQAPQCEGGLSVWCGACQARYDRQLERARKQCKPLIPRRSAWVIPERVPAGAESSLDPRRGGGVSHEWELNSRRLGDLRYPEDPRTNEVRSARRGLCP